MFASATGATYDTLRPVALPKTTTCSLSLVYLGQTWPRLLRGSAEGLAAKETQKAVLQSGNVSSYALLSNMDVCGCGTGRKRYGVLALHGVARLPLEFGRVAAELVVRTEDKGEVSCLSVSARYCSVRQHPQRDVLTAMHAAIPVSRGDVAKVARVQIVVRRQAVRDAPTAKRVGGLVRT
jgi:hypothetical protein